MHSYVKFARISAKLFSRILNTEKIKASSEKTVSRELLDAINFSGFDLEPYEVQLAAYAGALGLLFIITIVDLAIFVSVPLESNAALLILTSMVLPLAGLIYLSEFPKIYVRFMKVHSLGDIPEITSYLVMSMKLVPNMERAMSFAAENSHRPLAADLRKMIWDLHARVYSSLDEALIAFANLWGKESEYLKRALHIIKSSTNEPDEAQRVMTLNKSLDIVLDGTRTLMEGFAARLRTPTYVLYS
ncbi:MAG TPA: hypothetical protein HA257_02905, partial [Candidatus Methanoperedenaceae archaeon]|nr:hypothetical protein [Candidatus Methanoperedenaceae archaeon]